MITVLKVPIYLKIETDNIDRSKVTSLTQQVVIPKLIRHWQSKGLTGIFSAAEARQIDVSLGNNDWSLLTDVQALDGK